MKRFPKYKGPIQYINKEPYQICAVYPIVEIKDVSLVKDWLECDIAFKNNREGVYYFCDKIEEVEWRML